jgi:predicted permease
MVFNYISKSNYERLECNQEEIRILDKDLSMNDLLFDLRYAFRQFIKTPGITLVAAVTLALGIGASTGIFTLAWNVILKSLPVPRAWELVQYEMNNGSTAIGLSGPEFLALRQQQKSSVDVMAWTSDQVSMQEAGHLQRVRIQSISGNAFQLLEMQPFLGRPFEEQDNPAQTSQTTPAILSFEFWKQHFGGDRDVLGRTFVLSDHPVTVIGVMPQTFEGLTANFNPMIYLPLALSGSEVRNNPGRFSYFVLGRLKPGITITKAEAELRTVEPAIRREADPEGTYLNHTFKSFHLVVTSGRSGVSWVKTTFERPILVIEMLVALLLLFCCVNTALVMLARVSEHQQEYALRVALGAGRARLARQVIVESALLTLPGLAGGVLLGWGAAKALVTMLGERGNVASMDVSPNAYILAFNCSVSLLIALCAGAWPALRATRAAEAGDLRNTDRTVAASRFGGWLVALQVAISLSLITSAALTGETLTRLLSQHSRPHV